MKTAMMVKQTLYWLAVAMAAMAAPPALWAQGMEHGAHGDDSAANASANAPADAPPDARDPHAYSNGYTLESGPYALYPQRQLHMADEHSFGALQVNRLERAYARHGAGNATSYDAQARFGRDFDALVLKADGEVAQGKLQDARTELLWSHAIAAYWDVQAGVRHDGGTGPDRSWLALGMQGLAPYGFDVDAAVYLGESGRTALRLGVEYELLLSQRLVLEPRAEFNLYGKDDAQRGIGSGLANGTYGLRLRYEIHRQLAPYVGVEHANRYGQTADLARMTGEPAGQTRWVAGLRFWF